MAEQKKMDTKFSVALHILVMISESQANLTSSFLANSVGTNPSYVRKVISLLKKADLIASQQGRSGYALTGPASSISLLAIYQATQEVMQVQLFDIHQNGNQDCPVGRYIEAGLQPIFQELADGLAQDLASRSLQDVINKLYQVKGDNPI